MIKHVGKHNQKKIAIVYRQVPDEDHMALVMYADSLPSMVHDEVMSVLESEIGQNSKELADALFRRVMPDGNNCLTYVHKHGYLKKVPTNQIIVTPTAKSTVRLDELNTILSKIEAGGEAAEELANIDSNRGIRGVLNEGRELGQPEFQNKTTSGSITGEGQSNADYLSNEDLAQKFLTQATTMEAEAKGMIAEAKRLRNEAKTLTPSTKKAPNVRTTRKTKKTETQ